MKELINDLIKKSGLSNNEFAKAVGISESQLSQSKKLKNLNVYLLVSWAKTFKIKDIEGFVKEFDIHIIVKK